MRPPTHDQIMHAVYDAIAEFNETQPPEQPLATLPHTVLVGGSAQLDSVGFVMLVVTIEEKVEQLFERPISVIDIVMTAEGDELTVATLAKCLAQLLDPAA